ncbi:hypothetical protein K402DRAFT_451963, partial [Aulographum hederae CBS 113979]
MFEASTALSLQVREMPSSDAVDVQETPRILTSESFHGNQQLPLFLALNKWHSILTSLKPKFPHCLINPHPFLPQNMPFDSAAALEAQWRAWATERSSDGLLGDWTANLNREFLFPRLPPEVCKIIIWFLFDGRTSPRLIHPTTPGSPAQVSLGRGTAGLFFRSKFHHLSHIRFPTTYAAVPSPYLGLILDRKTNMLATDVGWESTTKVFRTPKDFSEVASFFITDKKRMPSKNAIKMIELNFTHRGFEGFFDVPYSAAERANEPSLDGSLTKYISENWAMNDDEDWLVRAKLLLKIPGLKKLVLRFHDTRYGAETDPWGSDDPKVTGAYVTLCQHGVVWFFLKFAYPILRQLHEKGVEIECAGALSIGPTFVNQRLRKMLNCKCQWHTAVEEEVAELQRMEETINWGQHMLNDCACEIPCRFEPYYELIEDPEPPSASSDAEAVQLMANYTWNEWETDPFRMRNIA